MTDLKKIIANFHKANILVIGDLILDEYIWGDVDRISPEAPVPVVWAKKHTYVPGGAANVANNISALGAKVCLAGVIGKDNYGKILINNLKERKISASGILKESVRHTTLKTRIIGGHQQVVRVDWEDIHNIKNDTRDTLQDFIQENVKKFDAVIIEDYGKGLLDQFLLGLITKEARKHKKIVTVDPKEDNFEHYRGATSITPNMKEAQNAVRYLKMKDQDNKFKIYNDKLITLNDIDTAGKMILQYLDLESLLITLGEDGMVLFEKNKPLIHIPTVAQKVFDVSGAGDTVIATFTLALSCGATKDEAARIANFAAGIVVGKVGTATASREELTASIK